jgi:hypothetical protein
MYLSLVDDLPADALTHQSDRLELTYESAHHAWILGLMDLLDRRTTLPERRRPFHSHHPDTEEPRRGIQFTRTPPTTEPTVELTVMGSVKLSTKLSEDLERLHQRSLKSVKR